MTEPIIEGQDLELTYGRKVVLRLPEFRVDPGQVVALLGRNGTGKTTLLKTCLGLHRPTRGRLSLLGKDLTSLGVWGRLRLRRQIGYVPQISAQASEVPLTVREVAGMGRTARAGLFRPMRRQDRRMVDAWLERLDLTRLAGRPFRCISGGEQRKTLLARAMAQEPEVLLLDEPTAWLDLGWREQIVHWLDLLYDLRRITIVLVCHELEVLPRNCRRVVLLQDGQAIACGSPEEVLTNQRVCEFYGGPFRVIHDAGRHAVLPTGGARP